MDKEFFSVAVTITSSMPQPSRGFTSFSWDGGKESGLSTMATSSLLIAEAVVDVVLEVVVKDTDEVDGVGVVSDGLSIEIGGDFRSEDMMRWAGFSCRAVILC